MRSGEFAKKELKDLLTDRVFLISFLLQFTIVSALLFLYQFYSVINSSTFPVTVQLDKYDANLVGRLLDSGVNVQVAAPEGIQTYRSGVRPTNPIGRISVAFNTSSNEVKTDVANIFSGYAISRIKEAAEEVSFEQALQQKNFKYSVSGIKEGNFAFLSLSYGIILPIALILPAFIVMSFTLQSILVERKLKTIELLLVSPLSNTEIAVAKIMPYALTAAVISVIWIFYVSSRFEILNIPVLAIIAFLFALFAVSISTVISCTAGSVKEANALSSLIGMGIPMLGILPYNAFSNYFPTVLMARVSSSYLNQEILFNIGVFSIACLISFIIAIKAISRMRVNFA